GGGTVPEDRPSTNSSASTAGETVTTILPGLFSAGCWRKRARPATMAIAAAVPASSSGCVPRQPSSDREGRVRPPLRRLRTAAVRSCRLSKGSAREAAASSIWVGGAGGLGAAAAARSAAHGPRNRRGHLAGAALDLQPARDPRLLFLPLALELLEQPLGQLPRSVRRPGLEGEPQEVVVHLARPLVAVARVARERAQDDLLEPFGNRGVEPARRSDLG